MDMAITNADSEKEKEELRVKKEKEISKLREELAGVKETTKSGCYVATAVFGSYDCPEVWTLRRYRDFRLATTWYGRLFIHLYYSTSPTLVKWFGSREWFRRPWRKILSRKVRRLQEAGFENTPYED